MAIEVKCHCGSEYRLDDSRAGQVFTCKVCGALVNLPVGSPRAVPPSQVPPVVLAHEGTAHLAEGQAKGQPPPAGLAAARTSTLAATAEDPSAEVPVVVTGPDAEVAEHVTRWPQAWAKAQSDPAPPMGWMILRSLILIVCGGFIFLPWYNMPQGVSGNGPLTVTPLLGWQVIVHSTHACVCSALDTRVGFSHSLPEMVGLDSVPADSPALAGAILMVYSPAFYGLSLLLGLVMLVVAYRHGGRGLVFPFVLYWLSLLGFLVGWLMVSQVVPVWRAGPETATVGVSIWVYTMLLTLVPVTLLVRTRPEYPIAPIPVMTRRGADAPVP